MRRVLHLNEFGSGARLATCASNNNGQNISGIRRAFANANHDWPVFIDDSHFVCTRYVGSGEDGFYARCRFGGRGINIENVCTHMLGEMKSAVQHAGNANVVYVPSVT